MATRRSEVVTLARLLVIFPLLPSCASGAETGGKINDGGRDMRSIPSSAVVHLLRQ
jgi:hypothetical protein